MSSYLEFCSVPVTAIVSFSILFPSVYYIVQQNSTRWDGVVTRGKSSEFQTQRKFLPGRSYGARLFLDIAKSNK